MGVLRGRLPNITGLTFSPNERIPSTLHTASLYHLLTCAKFSVALKVEFRQYLGGEHLRELLVDCIEDR